MRFAHKVGTPCPPSRPGLHVGPGSVRTDGTDDWCCHASPYLTDDDVARQRADAQRGRPRDPETDPAPDLDRFRPQRDADGVRGAVSGILFDIGQLSPKDTP